MTQNQFGIAKPGEPEATPDAGKTALNPPNAAPPSTVVNSVSALPKDQSVVAAPVPITEADEKSRPVRPDVRPHAFVVMPFGKKKGADGSPYDFNAIYKMLIKPALEEAGFESFRADEETAT